ncbi:AAA family ATPase [Natrialba sp. INN-245]|uniref:McrB family protein n=1 Tax=Natrialba sp. INN-245 TaxID=2690967 RepID=UPI00130FD519|nr:AAA family ATPase [Natrialba sp. INN-245]MWV38872.1 AAA domain-containing protein [Natrialba sp. INN-245]
MDFELTEDQIQSRVNEYKRNEDWEEKIETANEIAAAVRGLAESIVEYYDDQVGTDEMSTLFRLCQISSKATLSKKRSRVEGLDLPEHVKEDIKSEIPDVGIVGGGQAQISIPAEYESDAYQLLDVLVNSEDQHELDVAIDEFAALNIKGIQAGVLSPILFFLHPTKYPIINSASRNGMEALLDYTVSSQLSEYTREAEKFREFRDKYDLGGDDGNLRDVDWFFYTLELDATPAVWIEKTAIHGEYKKPGAGELSLGKAIMSPQRASGGRDFYSTLRDAEIGDIVVHLLKDKKEIAGVSVIDSDLITDYDFPEAVEQRWEAEQRERGGYLRRLTDFQELDSPPAVYDDFLDNELYKEELQRINDEHSGLFYDKNQILVQGTYFTACPDPLAEVLADISSELAEYFRAHGFEPHNPPQIFQIPLSDTHSMRDNFEQTVTQDVSITEIEDLVETEFDRETVRVWASGEESESEEPGDLLLFGDRDAEEYFIGATVGGSEQLSEDRTREFCDAVGWDYSERYRYLIYLDEVYEIELDGEYFWELMEYDGFPYDGFSRIYPDRVKENLIANNDYGSVDAFLEEISVSQLYPVDQNDEGPGEGDDDLDPVYYLWNTNYENADTDGSLAFQRGVAAAYGGDEWGRDLTRPNRGDILFAYLVGTGVIGVGVVIDETDGEPIDKNDSSIEPIKGLQTPEYHLPVDWIYTLPQESAVSISTVADLLNRKKMSHVGTIEKPTDQQGARDLYDGVRQRFTELHKTSSVEQHQNEDIERLLEAKKQVVFYGPPGTGKTYTARRFAEWLRAKKDANALSVDQIRTVTFHPSFSYEDFVEGFTASVENQQVEYTYEKGTFAEIVRDATDAYNNSGQNDDASPFFLIIDEINRGNLAQIFGESITLLEADKRLNQENEIVAKLAHSGEDFVIPPNLYIIGTMNTADESIALVDTALRRRFRFLPFPPELEIATSSYPALLNGDELADLLQNGGNQRDQLIAASILALRDLNERIIRLQHLGKGKQIGHTFLLGLETSQDIVDMWRFEILPQLEEYYFGQFNRLQSDLFQNGGDQLIDWEANQILAFDSETLYSALCEIAGISTDDRAPLSVEFTSME